MMIKFCRAHERVGNGMVSFLSFILFRISSFAISSFLKGFADAANDEQQLRLIQSHPHKKPLPTWRNWRKDTAVLNWARKGKKGVSSGTMDFHVHSWEVRRAVFVLVTEKGEGVFLLTR